MTAAAAFHQFLGRLLAWPRGCEGSKPRVDTVSGSSSKRCRASSPASPRPYSQLPCPKGLPVVGTLFDLIHSGAAPKIHEYCDRRHRELGPVYRETLGNVDAVFVADAKLIQRVYTAEGKFPRHLVPEPWTIYNEMTGNKRGLFFMDGPQWRERRRSLNKVFLRPAAISAQVSELSDITADLLTHWRRLRRPDAVLPDLEKELYAWSIECLGSFILGRRMGCLSAEASDEMRTFMECVHQIFVESALMTTIPPRLASTFNLPVWRRFVKAVGSALTIASSMVETKVREIVDCAESGEPVEGMLAQLLLHDHIQEDEIVRIVTDLFLAAADTTAHSTQWALNLLAQNRRCQERLRAEVDAVLPEGEPFTMEHISKLPYARAVVKEALRLYPVAPFLTRILTKDLVLGDYQIPAGKLVLMSMYTTGRDPRYFRRPEVFVPERWLKAEDVVSCDEDDAAILDVQGTCVGSESEATHASIPFGIGSRSCIGRRIAEAQMYLLLAKLVQRYDIESANENDVTIKMRMVAAPSEPILLRLVDRKTSPN